MNIPASKTISWVFSSGSSAGIWYYYYSARWVLAIDLPEPTHVIGYQNCDNCRRWVSAIVLHQHLHDLRHDINMLPQVSSVQMTVHNPPSLCTPRIHPIRYTTMIRWYDDTMIRWLQPVSCLESAYPVFYRDAIIPDCECIQYPRACSSYVMNIAASKSISWMISLIHSLGYDVIVPKG